MTTSQKAEAGMEQILNNISSLDEEKQFLIANCVANLFQGSHWGFISEKQAKQYDENVVYKNPYLKASPLKEGSGLILLESTDIKQTLKVLQEVAPSLVDQQFIQKYLEGTTNASKAYISFLKAQLKSKRGSQGVIGINSINKTNTMTYNGERKPAFQLQLKSLVALTAKHFQENNIGLNSFAIIIQGKPILLADLANLVQNNESQVLKYLGVSKGTTSVTVQYAIASPEKR